MKEFIWQLTVPMTFFILGWSAFVFTVENEKRAVRKMLNLILVILIPSVLLLWSGRSMIWIGLPLLCTWIILFFIWLIPTKFPATSIRIVEDRVDERTTIFSRMYELDGISNKSLSFYRDYPGYRDVDAHLRSLPGLLSPKSIFYDPVYVQKANEYDTKLKELFPEIDGKVNPITASDTPVELIKEIKKIAKDQGAVSIGFTKLKPIHFYSRKGRGSRYGDPIDIKHQYAIALTVEMDKEAVAEAPKAPVIAESMKQYYHSGNIAIQIAKHLRKNGFDARAHIDANYEVICPLVARDARLGDIGRMGLLMTPQLGPRVRIAVVTTNLELPLGTSNKDYSVQYFCSICKKCARACPSQAIQHGNMEFDGKVRYKINHEKCYEYWAKAGTDCARCMSVCPYSHPNNWFHNIIRSGIKRSRYFARLALLADDFFYGGIPKIK